jgi:hypothetical protein
MGRTWTCQRQAVNPGHLWKDRQKYNWSQRSKYLVLEYFDVVGLFHKCLLGSFDVTCCSDSATGIGFNTSLELNSGGFFNDPKNLTNDERYMTTLDSSSLVDDLELMHAYTPSAVVCTCSRASLS